MSVKIKGRLPKGDLDGLQQVGKDARLHPGTPIVVVAMLVPNTLTRNLEDAEDTHTVGLRVASIEALDGLDASAARALLSSAYERRTGKASLPFGTIGDESEPWIDVDPETGEIG